LKKGRRRRIGPQRFVCPPSSSICPTEGSPENPQEYFQNVTFFSSQKTTTPITTKNHQLTTFSPQKTIQKTHKNAQPPCKNRWIATQKKSRQRFEVTTDS
jgi:hypothetical protein